MTARKRTVYRTGSPYAGPRVRGKRKLSPWTIARKLTRYGKLDYVKLLENLSAGQTAAVAAREAGSTATNRAGLKRVGLWMIRRLEQNGVRFRLADRIDLQLRAGGWA